MSRNQPIHGAPGGVGRWLDMVCKGFAAAGGLVLLAVTLLTVVGVVGRNLFNTPLPGSFELVEVGCAIAIFTFLPYCQLHKGNVTVGFFTANLSVALNHLLSAVGDLLYLLIAGLLTWRLYDGALDFLEYGEQTMVLRLPLWWSFVPILPSCALLAAVCGYTSWHHLRAIRR